jgi:hypothetical protein
MNNKQNGYFQDYVFEYCEKNGYNYISALVIMQNKEEIINTFSFQWYYLRRVVGEFCFSILDFIFTPIVKFLVKILGK